MGYILLAAVSISAGIILGVLGYCYVVSGTEKSIAWVRRKKRKRK